MKKKIVALLLCVAMTTSLVSCGQESPAVTSVSSVEEPAASEEISESVSEEVSKEAAEEAPVKEKPEIYGPDGQMYIEFTEDYYVANSYLGLGEYYDIDAYAYKAPYVGRWLNNDGSGEGVYFYSDDYMSCVYADGSIEPLAWGYCLDDKCNIVDCATMTIYTVEDGVLADSEGNKYTYSLLEFPYDSIAPRFYGFWRYDSNPDYYIRVNPDNTADVCNDTEFMTGTIELISPTTIRIIDDEDNTVCTLKMEGYGIAMATGDELLTYFDDEPKG